MMPHEQSTATLRTEPLLVICAWCGVVLETWEGGQPATLYQRHNPYVSHGICEQCKADVLAEVE